MNAQKVFLRCINCLLLIMFFICFVPSAQAQVDDDSTIIWSKDRKLKFSDFKTDTAGVKVSGDAAYLKQLDSFASSIRTIHPEDYDTENRNSLHNNSSQLFDDYLAKYAEGYVGTSIYTEYVINKDSITYNIYAKCDKYRSLLRVYDTCTLEHEQLHFDICELYARKLKKCLRDSLAPNPTRAIVDSIITKYNYYMAEADLNFDEGAGFDICGLNVTFGDEIYSLINKYKMYKDARGSVQIKVK